MQAQTRRTYFVCICLQELQPVTLHAYTKPDYIFVKKVSDGVLFLLRYNDDNRKRVLTVDKRVAALDSFLQKNQNSSSTKFKSIGFDSDGPSSKVRAIANDDSLSDEYFCEIFDTVAPKGIHGYPLRDGVVAWTIDMHQQEETAQALELERDDISVQQQVMEGEPEAFGWSSTLDGGSKMMMAASSAMDIDCGGTMVEDYVGEGGSTLAVVGASGEGGSSTLSGAVVDSTVVYPAELCAWTINRELEVERLRVQEILAATEVLKQEIRFAKTTADVLDQELRVAKTTASDALAAKTAAEEALSKKTDSRKQLVMARDAAVEAHAAERRRADNAVAGKKEAVVMLEKVKLEKEYAGQYLAAAEQCIRDKNAELKAGAEWSSGIISKLQGQIGAVEHRLNLEHESIINRVHDKYQQEMKKSLQFHQSEIKKLEAHASLLSARAPCRDTGRTDTLTPAGPAARAVGGRDRRSGMDDGGGRASPRVELCHTSLRSPGRTVSLPPSPGPAARGGWGRDCRSDRTTPWGRANSASTQRVSGC